MWIGSGVLAGSVAASSEPVSLTTESAVRMAMAHNEDLRIAAADATSSRHRVREVRADGLPDVRATIDYSRNWLLPSIVFNNTSVKIGSDNEMTGVVRMSQPLYAGGRVSGSLQSARYRVEVSDELERQARQQVVARVEVALYDYLLAREIAHVSRLALVRARSNQRQVLAQHQVGRASQFELMRSGVQVASAASDSIHQGNEWSLAELRLKDVIGLPLDTDVEVAAPFRHSTRLPLDDLDVLIATARHRRPERPQLEALGEVRQGELRVAHSGARPSLDLVALGQMNFQDDTFDDVGQFDEWRRSWSTGLLLQVPLFDGLRSRAQVAQARQAVRRLELERGRVERAIEAEVRQAWMKVGEAGERQRAREGSVEQGQKGLADAESRYRAGAGTQLEVLDAQLALVEAESEHVRARRDRSTALVELELAAGVLGEE